MKKINFLIFVITFCVCHFSHAEDFKLLIKYLDGEHSKDSWSKEIAITIDKREYSYTMQSSGHIKPKSEVKNGTFTIDQYEKLRTYILDNNLLKSDSLFDESTKYSSFERFTNTEIEIFIDTAQ